MMDFQPTDARVLIVEDTAANIALLTSMLRRIGYRDLRSIMDPRQTVHEVETFKPDLIILDLMMPHLDGFQVMQQLRTVIPEQTYLPILVLTADASPASKRKALASGAHDFLLKPFDASEIFMRIRNLIQTRFFYLALQDQTQSFERRIAERTAELSAALEQLKKIDRPSSGDLAEPAVPRADTYSTSATRDAIQVDLLLPQPVSPSELPNKAVPA